MALAVGSLGYVDYGEVPRVIHARLILDHVIGHTYVILTPDHHIYEECLNADENEDIDRFWPGQPNGSPPRSVPANCVYGFAPMSANQVARFMNLGAAVGRRLRGELGIDVEVARQGAAQTATGVADAVDAGPVVAHQPALRDGEYYVLAEMVLGKKIGERLEVPVDAPRLGDYVLVNVNDSDGKSRPCIARKVTDATVGDFCDERIALARSSESCEGLDRSSSEDVRTLEVRYGFNGERHGAFVSRSKSW